MAGSPLVSPVACQARQGFGAFRQPDQRLQRVSNSKSVRCPRYSSQTLQRAVPSAAGRGTPFYNVTQMADPAHPTGAPHQQGEIYRRLINNCCEPIQSSPVSRSGRWKSREKRCEVYEKNDILRSRRPIFTTQREYDSWETHALQPRNRP